MREGGGRVDSKMTNNTKTTKSKQWPKRDALQSGHLRSSLQTPAVPFASCVTCALPVAFKCAAGRQRSERSYHPVMHRLPV